MVLAAGAQAAPLPAVALYYGNKIPLDEFRAFDIVVVDPDQPNVMPDALQPTTQVYAYASVGEVLPSRPYYHAIPAAWIAGRNGDWQSQVINQSEPGWPEFFATHVIQPLWDRGFRGFFLDTLDSYRLVKTLDPAAQQAGLVRVIDTLHQRFPGIHLIINRGFDILPQVHDKVDMVAAESLYQRWDAAAKRYTEVTPQQRNWLMGQLRTVQTRWHLPVLVIDYVKPQDRALARATAAKIRRDGFIPWVTDADLSTMGISSIEVVPRRVLILYDGGESPNLNESTPHRYLQMPLNYMGYIADYVDVRHGTLPLVYRDRYAGVVSWFSGFIPKPRRAELRSWIEARVHDGMPVAVIGDWGTDRDGAFDDTLGLAAGTQKPQGALREAVLDPMMGFEHPAPRPADENALVQASAALAGRFKPLVELRDGRGQAYYGGAITPWGGFMLDPNVLYQVPGTQQTRWLFNPFAFLREALRLPPFPVPDTTTENGRRLLMAHVDGDGSADIAALPGKPLALDVLKTQVFEKYPIPQTMSVIQGEVGPDGLYPQLSPRLEAAARQIFRLPNIEIGDHTYSHPFILDPVNAPHPKGQKPTLADLPNLFSKRGYVVNLQREIVGSEDFINDNLAPKGKRVKVLQWPGDAEPTVAWLAEVYKAGLLNINGGDTYITRANPSLTTVAAFGIHKDGYLQVYAPMANEELYTNVWHGPFYGFERVIQTFEMTNTPRRIKPVDIYYHVYSASKQASLTALHKVFDWAMAQRLYPVFTSEFITKMQDFYDYTVARDGDGWRLRGKGELRTVRLPAALGQPELAGSRGVAGWRPGVDGTYVSLTGGSAFLETGKEPSTRPYLYDANARIADWQPGSGGDLRFDLKGHVPLEFALANTRGCRVRAGQRTLATTRPIAGDPSFVQQFKLPDAAAQIQIACANR